MNNQFKVNKSSRLDLYLAEITSYSRSQISKLIKNEKIQVNSNIVTKPSFLVKEDDIIDVDFSLSEVVNDYKPSDSIKIDYLYRDKYLAVINKPRGLVVHPSSGHINDTLVNYLSNQDDYYVFDVDDINSRPGIVHRIDKDTQGVLIIAYSLDVMEKIQKQIIEGKVHRNYLALVNGVIKDKFFKVDAPLTKPTHTQKKALVNPSAGREAISHFELLSTKNNVSLLKCTLETGRTHQIRAHLAYLSHPVVGDYLYGDRNTKFKKGQCLSAYRIEFTHPILKKNIISYAPLDEYFKEILRFFYN